MFSSKKTKYLKNGRLEDVLALLQVLSLGKFSHRSEMGLQYALSSNPSSADTWTQVAEDHQEFFRIVDTKKHPISVVLRHAAYEKNNPSKPLTPEQTQSLLNTAIELHDRQVKLSSRWVVLIPIWVAALGAVATIATKAIN